MTKEIRNSAINAIIVTIVTIFINLIVTSITNEKAILRIGNVIDMGANNYQVSIDILNYGDNGLENIRINVPQNIDLSKIRVNKPVQINKINTTIGANYGDVIEISKIPGGQNLQLILNTDKMFDFHDILVDKNKNRLQIEYIDEYSVYYQEKFMSVIIYSILFGIVTLFSSYTIYRNRNKLKEFYEERSEILNKELDVHEKKITALVDKAEYYKTLSDEALEKSRLNQEETNKIKNETKRLRLLLLTKIDDYKKELNFWRDTIRKVIYSQGGKREDAENLINSITDNLKTYQTKSKNDIDLDVVLHLSELISRKDD